MLNPFHPEVVTRVRRVRDAIEAGDPPLVRRVFREFPAELNNNDRTIGCHLHHACYGGHLAVVQAMVEVGADINLADNRDGIAPIVDACGVGRVEVVRYLLSLDCALDVSASVRNPLFACIASTSARSAFYANHAGYSGIAEVRASLVEVANLLIDHGIDLTACYNQQSMVDMDASAFAYMFWQPAIGDAVIASLYGQNERLVASAIAEAMEVAVGNARSRQKFRRWRYPPTRGKNAGITPPEGEFWVRAGP